MTRRRWAWVAGVVVALVVALAVVIAPKVLERDSAREAIAAYNVALARATSGLDPELMSSVTTPAEKQRVANYVTLLWAEGTRLESSILSLEVVSFEREGEGYSVTVREVWRYQERDRVDGSAKGEVERKGMTLRYTLVRVGDRLVVERAELLEGER